MKQLASKVVLLVLLSTSIWLAGIQNVYGQSLSLYDSLRLMLTDIEQNINDSILQKAAKEAQLLYKTNNIDNILSKKLLSIDSLLVNSAQVNETINLNYASTL